MLSDGRIAAEGSADELKRLIPGGHVRLRFADPAAYQSAAVALREATRDDEALALQIPATAASANCAPSSTGWTRPASRRTS
ncbi:hypothetical protein SAURM35S_06895 [Streptomyces aurantiogriseus]